MKEIEKIEMTKMRQKPHKNLIRFYKVLCGFCHFYLVEWGFSYREIDLWFIYIMIWFTGGYPKKLKIENTILAFLEFEDGKPFCSMATVSNLYGIAASTCVQGINLSIKQTFATSYEKKYSVKKKRKVIGMKGEDGMDITLTNTPLILIIVSNSTANLWFQI